MKLGAIVPSAPEVLREAIIVLAGALLAMAVVKALPSSWQQWFNLSGGNQK